MKKREKKCKKKGKKRHTAILIMGSGFIKLEELSPQFQKYVAKYV